MANKICLYDVYMQRQDTGKKPSTVLVAYNVVASEDEGLKKRAMRDLNIKETEKTKWVMTKKTIKKVLSL